LAAVQIIPQAELFAAEPEAMARIGQRDQADWPAVAGALQFDCPVWTEDEDFFGSGVATWTTATVEIFLHGE
jgi:predicted nucleic acid-binding protein